MLMKPTWDHMVVLKRRAGMRREVMIRQQIWRKRTFCFYHLFCIFFIMAEDGKRFYKFRTLPASMCKNSFSFSRHVTFFKTRFHTTNIKPFLLFFRPHPLPASISIRSTASWPPPTVVTTTVVAVRGVVAFLVATAVRGVSWGGGG